MNVFVVVPVFNEETRAVDTIRQILANFGGHIICVDDGSTDNSYILLRKSFSRNKRVKIVRHKQNLGKGVAMETGVMMAWKLGAEAVIFIDSDGQHSPTLLPQFIKALSKYSLVFGFRKLDKNMPKPRVVLNKVAGVVFANLFNIKRHDLLCGYFGVRKDVYKDIAWKSRGYEVEMEIATRVGRKKLNFKEIEVKTVYLDKQNYSKGMSLLEAIKISRFIPWWYFFG